MNLAAKFIGMISGNLSVKLSSLVIAMTLWLFVVTGSEYVHVMKLPIILRNLQTGRVLAEPIPEYAEVKMRGTGRQFLNNMLTRTFADKGIMLEMGRIKFYYEFALEPYLRSYPDRFEVPRDFGLELVEIISPDTVRVRLDSYREKEVPVRPRVTISTDPGYIQVGELIINPPKVRISGPASILDTIEELFTEERSFEARKNNVKATISVEIDQPQLVQISQPEIELKASIQSIGERRVEGIEVQVRNVPENLKAIVNPPTVSIELQGGIAFLTGLTGENIDASIDYSKDWKENQRLYRLRIEVPKDVTNWKSLTPSEVEVIVIRERRASESPGN